ncbi:MAG: GreA/GreB family elongation factor [Bdellovibrio sp.]|nr:GreA/GreB family elongation factor [Methylotenera sp.]
MSRGFVKEDDLEHAGTDVPERSISTHPNYVTVNGYALLEKQANELELQRKALSANKEDQQAQQQLAIVNRDLRYVAARLENSLITRPDRASKQVLFGAKVTVEDEEGDSHTYEIVGEDEADIKACKVSWTSPLSKALIGQKLGESVVWARPAGNTVLEITALKYE